MAYLENLPDRLQRTDIDQLTILEAAEQLSGFCLEAPDRETEDYAVRMVMDGLYAVATETKLAPGLNGAEESWVARVRIANAVENPFTAGSGLEIILPYGANAHGVAEDPRVPYLNAFHAGIFVSYPFDGSQWCGRPLWISRTKADYDPIDLWEDGVGGFDLVTDTVKRVDVAIEREARGPTKNFAGFYLADILADTQEILTASSN